MERIVAIEDSAVRNLWITESYAHLGRRLTAFLGPDLSWCSFATWASNTAGASIRGQELPALATTVLTEATDRAAGVIDAANAHHPLLRRLCVGLLDETHAERMAEMVLSQVSAHIAHGNTLVFGELAPLFVGLVEHLESPEPGDGDDEATLDELGVPRAAAEPLVRAAFRAYLAAASCTDAEIRAEYVLAANISAVLHEQQRLQADIAASMNACLLELDHVVDAACRRWLPERAVRGIVEPALDRCERPVTSLWDHIATDTMMHLETPTERLDLGRDVPPLPDGRRFPAALDQIHSKELQALLDEWDPTEGTGAGSAARSWADLHQRMGYIVNLFRSRQQTAALLGSPFTGDDRAAMRRLTVPARLSEPSGSGSGTPADRRAASQPGCRSSSGDRIVH